MGGIFIAHSADFPLPMPGVVDPALAWGFAGLLHPHPDSLGKSDDARKMVSGNAHIFEIPVAVVRGMTNDQIDDFLQYGVPSFKADHPIEYRIIGMLQVVPDRSGWRAQENRRVGVGSRKQKISPIERFEGNELRRVACQYLAKRNRQGALDVAVYAPLSKENAVPPDIGFQNRHANFFEYIQNGVPCIIGIHIGFHLLVIEKAEGVVPVQPPEAPYFERQSKRKHRSDPGLVDSVRDPLRQGRSFRIKPADANRIIGDFSADISQWIDCSPPCTASRQLTVTSSPLLLREKSTRRARSFSKRSTRTDRSFSADRAS